MQYLCKTVFQHSPVDTVEDGGHWSPFLFFPVFIRFGHVPQNFSNGGRRDQGLDKQHVYCFDWQ